MYKKIVAFLCALSLLLPIGIHASDDLYLGGDSIGIQLDYNGVMITGTYPFVVQGETYDPGGTIQPSDILVKVNQVPICPWMNCISSCPPFRNLSMRFLSKYDAVRTPYRLP